MANRIFSAFLVIFVAVILAILPATESIHDFLTDIKTDRFTIETGAAETTGNATLVKSVYDDDTSSIELSSTDSDDAPLMSSYNTTSRLLEFSGLAVSTNRTIAVQYEAAAFSGFNSISTLFDVWPFLYYVILVAFVVAAQIFIWTGRAD